LPIFRKGRQQYESYGYALYGIAGNALSSSLLVIPDKSLDLRLDGIPDPARLFELFF
jgi:hypothetical protein